MCTFYCVTFDPDEESHGEPWCKQQMYCLNMWGIKYMYMYMYHHVQMYVLAICHVSIITESRVHLGCGCQKVRGPWPSCHPASNTYVHIHIYYLHIRISYVQMYVYIYYTYAAFTYSLSLCDFSPSSCPHAVQPHPGGDL